MAPVYCKTDHAILLLAVRDERGILRFPSSPGAVSPGIHFPVRALMPIQAQLTAAASDTVGRDVALHFRLCDEFADEIRMADGREATLYVANLEEPRVVAPNDWPVMPAILRSFPRDKSRIPYLRAWQILQGGLQLNTLAVDAEEVKKHFDD